MRAVKAAYIGGPDLGLRIPLIKMLRDEGLDVHAIGSDRKDEQRFIDEGIPYHYYHLTRTLSITGDLRALRELRAILERERFSLVHAFDTKPSMYGRLAAARAGVPVIIGTIPGMGTLFSSDGLRERFLRLFYIYLQKKACAASAMTVFQNSDDMEFFLSKAMVAPERSMIIKGSGVDVKRFSPEACGDGGLEECVQELGLDPGKVNFFMISRLVHQKGVFEYFEAAGEIKKKRPEDADFYLVGPFDDTISAVTREELDRYGGHVRYLGVRNDIQSILCLSTVVVLPSYYREGVPRVLLEASAMEVPIITTSAPGCREVVDDGKTGYMVPPKDSLALARAMERMIDGSEGVRGEMGKRARQRILGEYSLERVLEDTIKLYNRLLNYEDTIS